MVTMSWIEKRDYSADLRTFASTFFILLFLVADLRGEEKSRLNDNEQTVTLENAIVKTRHDADLAAQVAGLIAELSVVEGDRVTKGQILVRIDSSIAAVELEQARIAKEIVAYKLASQVDLELAKKSLAVASNELQRARRANQRVAETYPTIEIDRLQLIADRAQLEVERASQAQKLLGLELSKTEAESQMVEAVLQRHQIRAPFDGEIVSVDKIDAEWVEPGTRVLQLVSFERLRIEGFVDQKFVSEGLKGSLARVGSLRDNSEDQGSKEKVARKPSIEAKVGFVSHESNPVNGKVRVFVDVDNLDHRLRPGDRVDVQITVTR